MNALKARLALKKHASRAKALVLQRFFKTGPGEYGYGDIFIGVMVPQTRKVAKAFSKLPLPEIKKLISSKVHEERLLALAILVMQYGDAAEEQKEKLFKFYLSTKKHINNWDLIDLTAPKIVGEYLMNRDRAVLYVLSKSKSMWDRRIAILATFYFIKRGDFKDTIALATVYLNDKEDLMHKATGWMLREMGKVDVNALRGFLNKNYTKMPRTMLRYAIERLPESERLAYLKGKV